MRDASVIVLPTRTAPTMQKQLLTNVHIFEPSCTGLGYFYLWCHTPYKCDNYDHFAESPLFLYVVSLAADTHAHTHTALTALRNSVL